MQANRLYSREFSEYKETLLENVELEVERSLMDSVKAKVLPYLEKDVERLNGKLIIGKLMRVGE